MFDLALKRPILRLRPCPTGSCLTIVFLQKIRYTTPMTGPLSIMNLNVQLYVDIRSLGRLPLVPMEKKLGFAGSLLSPSSTFYYNLNSIGIFK